MPGEAPQLGGWVSEVFLGSGLGEVGGMGKLTRHR